MTVSKYVWKEVLSVKVNIVYPTPKKESLLRLKLISTLRWPLAFAAYACVITNIITGGSAWSVVVIWSLWILWTMVISPTLVDYNRISQLIKILSLACFLLLLIELLLSSGWAVEVIPIVWFSGLIIAGVLFFTDLERQTQNMLPLLLMIAVSLVCSVAGLIIWNDEAPWALTAMGAFALALFIGCICTLGTRFFEEIKKRFYTK